MAEYLFEQLVDFDKIRDLLQAHSKITGICSGILDLDQNILLAEGWQDICTLFHRVHPETAARCLESNEILTRRLHGEGEYQECKCRNGLWDIAMPIVIDGNHLATFFTGQFFYAEDQVYEEFFHAQAVEFGFDEEAYIAALRRIPVVAREQVRNIMGYYRNLVQVMAESGLQKLELAREVEEKKKAEKAFKASRDFLEKIIDSISDPIFVKDREHRMVLVNEAECALAGRSREEMLGRTDYEFFSREQVVVFWEKDELVFATGQPNLNEEEITDAQGEARVIVTKKNLYRDRDGDQYLVGIIRDITEHKKLEQALFAAKRMEIIGQLAGGVAHEVRNPLNAILAISEALFREKEIAGNPEYMPYIEHIRTQVGRLSKLMTDLLDLGKPIKATSIAPVSLKDICAEAVSLWQVTELAKTHPLEYAPESAADDLIVNADATRLLQVLLNLVENGAQHSPAGSVICLHAVKVTEHRVALRIQDAGKGIAPEKIGRIFEPFFTTRRGGTGLGLSLVKHFVENMGGDVRIRNNDPPPGCTVELVLGIAKGKRGREDENTGG